MISTGARIRIRELLDAAEPENLPISKLLKNEAWPLYKGATQLLREKKGVDLPSLNPLWTNVDGVCQWADGDTFLLFLAAVWAHLRRLGEFGKSACRLRVRHLDFEGAINSILAEDGHDKRLATGEIHSIPAEQGAVSAKISASLIKSGDTASFPKNTVVSHAEPSNAPAPSHLHDAGPSRYEFQEHVGTGLYGEVWRARDIKLDRDVAIKFIVASGVSNDALAHARALTRFSHPNIVSIFDVTDLRHPATNAQSSAIIMEFVEGEQLNKRLQRAINADDARRIAKGIVEAVAAYQAHRLAHRDLHGKNVIVGGQFVKIIDASCSDSGYVSSTAGLVELFRRDVEWVQSHMVSMLKAGASTMDALFEFQQETLNPTLDLLQERFATALGNQQEG